MSAGIEVRSVAKRFGGLVAVDDVSLTVRPGEICSIIGPNGAGKTTLFNLVSAFFRPDNGAIIFEGKDISKCRAHDLAGLGIGRTFQNLALFSHESVVQNILVGLHSHLRSSVIESAFHFGRPRAEEIKARERVEEIIEFLKIGHLRDRQVGTLAYGLQKRVEMARALAVSPKMLLLDEMVSGMNQEEREDIARFVLDLKEELGMTVVMIEHDMGIVMDISDRVCVLHQGRLIANGTPSEVSADPMVIAAYLGQERGK